jgi:hypothetical protein
MEVDEQKKEAPDQRASFVEMAGVEPASEERTIKPTTYIVLSFTLHFNSSDRQDAVEATPSFPLPGSKIVVEENEPLACLKSAPLRNPTGGISRDGLLN